MLKGNNAVLNAQQLTVEINGRYGIEVDANNASLDLGSGSKIALTSNSMMANGIYQSHATSLRAAALTIITQGLGSGLYITDTGTWADLGTNSLIQTQGEQATGIYIFGRDSGTEKAPASLKANRLASNTTGDYAYGINIQPDSEVDLGQQSAIETHGEGAVCIWALGGGYVQGDNLSITGNDGSIGVYAMTASDIDLTGKTVINMASPLETAIGTQHNEGYRASRINLSGQADIFGSLPPSQRNPRRRHRNPHR
ncbi:hypothetical protein [Mixta sp. Marseille-Q2659]|uniref:hypothetical protein n=1 Tax=Mixta sp. Marseille-Q2659 TaxID=2736607 RepID=UPI0023B8A070|nr:hypothetical protein [Mixta sp. Marseille-Q2659]